MTEVYHVVTGRPMRVGQTIIFDDEHRSSGVYRRVHDKMDAVREIYAEPERFRGASLEHHTAVALRELAMEEIRLAEFSELPSRLTCLYVCESLSEAEQWGDYFASLGRATYHIVRLGVEGRVFRADASKCFDGVADKAENLRRARLYWQNEPPTAVHEMLADGVLTVLEIVKEIDRNI